MISTARVPKLTVVISRGQSRAPEKRALESEIHNSTAEMSGVRTVSIPHLYDLPPRGETLAMLREIEGDIVFLSWVFPRAARWVLDRNGVSGRHGVVFLTDREDAESESESVEHDENPLTGRVLEQRDLPDRDIYCIDLRVSEAASDFVAEIERILKSASVDSLTSSEGGQLRLRTTDDLAPFERLEPLKIDEGTTRRWYPVIDYSRCTNCMECIDFCLFGVYGVDGVETILVEQPDNCRKGCPACSRVCPENAIIFPQHKTPAIAGADTDDGTGLKIDLSLLFGAPEKEEDPIAAAARERDEQLLLAGRAAVGLEVGIPKRHHASQQQPKDELDDLIDALDDYDL